MSDPKVKANRILMVELTGRIKLNVDQAEMIIVEYIITVGF
jgi:hypothetical protein